MFKEINGFDADYRIFLEDTDLLWRIWLSGYKVYFYPEIVVHHAYGTGAKSMHYYRENRVNYYGPRNMITTLLKNLGIYKLVFIVPLNIMVWVVLAIGSILRGNIYRGYNITQGVFAGLLHSPWTLIKRYRIQKTRCISDKQLFEVVGRTQGWKFYLDKAKTYIVEKPY